MKIRLSMLVCLLGLAGTPTGLDAQVPSVGDRVEVVSDALPRHERSGRFLGVSAGVLRLEVDDERVPIPIASIRTLRVWIGERRSTYRGMLVGTVVGTVAGRALTQDFNPNDPLDDPRCSGAECYLLPIAGGAALGALIGSFIRYDEWSEPSTDWLESVGVPVDGIRLAVLPDPLNRTATLHLTFGW